MKAEGFLFLGKGGNFEENSVNLRLKDSNSKQEQTFLSRLFSSEACDHLWVNNHKVCINLIRIYEET